MVTSVVPHAGDVDRNAGEHVEVDVGLGRPPRGDVDRNAAGFSTLS